MIFRKKNFAEKLLLKFTNKERYGEYKWQAANAAIIERTQRFNGGDRLNTIQKLKDFAKNHTHLNVLHSGNAGDIIYALPSLKRIHELAGLKINLLLKLNQPLILHRSYNHPLGNVMLNEKMLKMLSPLLHSQKYIINCGEYTNQHIDIDLDDFRRMAIPMDGGNIARWCSYITGVTPELYKPWLEVESNPDYSNTIVLARSERYRNNLVNYSFLKKYPNLLFVGVESEYKDMSNLIPGLQWVQVDDFLELASIIAGCKFFIGNQSFPFALAEGLKVPRILEASYRVTNVVPEGENAHDFYFQDHFEALVAELNLGK